MTDDDEMRAFNAMLRSDFPAFLRRVFLQLNPGQILRDNFHLHAISYELQLVRRRESNRLIVNMPPRHLKSIMVSVAFPAYLLGLDPKLRIFGISYADDLARKHADDFRAVVESDWYRRAFPRFKIARAVDGEVHTTERGFRKSTSVYSVLTGLGGTLFILDDVQKPIDAQSELQRGKLRAWFSNTLLSRLDNKEWDAIIVVMQRVHQQDFAGCLLESGGWRHLKLAAIAEEDERIAIGPNKFHFRKAGEALHPAYESLATLEKMREELGPDTFASQYQQVPVPPGGGMFKKAWLRFYTAAPERAHLHRIIQSWDTAAKTGERNDYSVCTTWLLADSNYYLLDCLRGRFEYPDLRAAAIALAERFKPNAILIEDTSAGTSLAQELIQHGRFPVRPFSPEHDKEGRAYVQQGKFARGQILFPQEAPFMPDVLNELLMFPHGRTDDIVDSIMQALAFQKWGYDSTLSWV
jgi:predicted phage terminase large subunit-like protein